MNLSELQNRLAGGRIFHAYIVTGSDADGRERAGRLIAGAAVCSGAGRIPCGVCRDCRKAERDIHPDIEFIRLEKTAREHTVDSMRAVRAQANVMPNEARRSVYIIVDADAMNIQSQNAMLKVFEEPPKHAVFVLLAENPLRLLETVRSRCEIVNLAPAKAADARTWDGAGDVVASWLSGDNGALMRAVLTMEKLSRAELPQALGDIRAAALAAVGRPGGPDPGRISQLDEAVTMAEKMAAVNVSAVHITGLLTARLCRKD